MSRTDKTRPLRVKAMDTPTGIEAQHDHSLGPCDLPAKPTRPLECLWGDRATRCYWAASWEFLRSPAGHCACSVHAKKYDNYYVQSKARAHTARRRVEREGLTDARTYGADDLADVPSPTADIELELDREYGGYLADVEEFGELAERLDLPFGAVVVGTGNLDGHRCCSSVGGLYGLHDHPDTHAEVLHPDGRRERVPVDRNDEAVPGGFDEVEVADDFDLFADPYDYLDDLDADLYSERMRGPGHPSWYLEATGATS